MSGKFVVGYDGSAAGRRAVDFAVIRAAAESASLVIVHVLEWSPYAFLTPTELEERHKRRTEELQRAEEHVMSPLTKALKGSGVTIETEIKYGRPSEVLCDIARKTDAQQIIVGRDGATLSTRVFGSVASALVQVAPVPCTIVP